MYIYMSVHCAAGAPARLNSSLAAIECVHRARRVDEWRKEELRFAKSQVNTQSEGITRARFYAMVCSVGNSLR